MPSQTLPLSQLANLRNLNTPEGILSVYLPIDASLLPRGHVAGLMDLLDVLRATSGEENPRFEIEAQRVLDFVRGDYVPSGATLVAFSSEPLRLWEVLEFQRPLPGLVRFGERPFLLPLDVLSQDHPAAAVVLVGQEEARLFRLTLGELRPEKHLHSDVPGRQRQGGWAASRYEDDRQEHIRQHLRRVAEALQEMRETEPFSYVLAGGTHEVTSALADAMSPELKPLLAGAFRMEMFAGEPEIATAARELLEETERARELRVVEEAIGLALDGRRAALGTEETLQVLRDGRVHTLVLSDAIVFSPDGERAAGLAADTGAELEVVHGAAAGRLTEYEGFAALLRY